MKNRIKYYSLFMLALLTIISFQSFGQGFSSSPISWSTPDYFNQISDFGGSVQYTTMDIDGDSKPDLVVTYDNGIIGSTGNYSWDVYLNNGSGFNSSPVSWSTPDYFQRTSDFGGSVQYTTMDIDGDSKPDLVVTYDNGIIGSAGNYSWDVYLNNGSGFNSSPISWSTPDYFQRTSDFGGSVQYTTMDMDGDNQPDLIVTYDNGLIGSAGNYSWNVYLNNGSGFNSSPVSWSTPDYFERTTYFGGSVQYTTMDMDGDSQPDLVVTYDNGIIGSTGNYSWDVYLNNGSGFNSSPVSWSTPDYFERTTYFGGSVKHTTMDIDGDSQPDLVVTYDNGIIGSAGNYSWNVYLNNGTGFNSSPVSWSTPEYFDRISDFGGSLQYTTMDITGDNKPDLVVTYDNGVIGTAGNYSWDVYLNLSTVSVEQLDNSSLSLKVYPNPTSGLIHLDCKEQVESIELLDALGRKVRVYSGDQKAIEIGNAPGVYFLRIKADGREKILRVVKE